MTLRPVQIRALALIAAVATGFGCTAPARDAGELRPALGRLERRAALMAVRAFEDARRKELELGARPRADVSLGPNPFDLVALPEGGYAGLLRGRSAVVELDAELREVRRLVAPRSPTGLASGPDGTLWVSGEADARIFRYRRRAGVLELVAAIPTRAQGVRDLSVGRDGNVHLLDAVEGRVLRLDADPRQTEATCRGGTALWRAGPWLAANCLLEHTLKCWRVEGAGRLRQVAAVTHDGPFWSFDAVATVGDELLVAAAGVENHALDRTIGAFGYIDSFLFLYRVGRAGAVPLGSLNLSEHGVVVPKTVRLEASDSIDVDVTSFGSDRRVRVRFDARGAPRVLAASRLPPGTTAAIQDASGDWALANPLFDAWLKVRDDSWRLVRTRDAEQRSPEERVGELLAFTTLIAPRNTSKGPLSRFTCETCHFEGGVDGRVHHTGRGDVRVSTKPLFGLANNRPHFSRALDPDLTTVAHNEFRVAGAGSGADPWFPIRVAELPWLRSAGVEATELSPGWLRRAFVAFFANYHPPPNVIADSRADSRFRPIERAGAELFRDRCESCHQARAVSDLPASRLPFDEWEAAIFGGRGVVWAASEYEQTGIEPYVHARGARVPSLRRAYAKWPHFTDGSATDLTSVLAAASWQAGGRFWHRMPPGLPHQALFAGERAALLAFLRLL